MSDIFSHLFDKFGIKSILFAIAVSILIWIFAHVAASPGTEVSVLWGLVRYTKSSNNKIETTFSKNEKDSSQVIKNSITQKTDTSYLPISLFTKYNLSKTDFDKFIISYREKNGIREIETMESGKPARVLSDGIYSFVSESWITSESVSVFRTDFQNLLLNMTTTRFRSSDMEFEIHFINKDKIMLLGFMNKKDAAEISFLSGKKSHSIIFSPIYFSDFTTFVAIPVDRIVSSYDRTIEISKKEWHYVLEVTIK